LLYQDYKGGQEAALRQAQAYFREFANRCGRDVDKVAEAQRRIKNIDETFEALRLAAEMEKQAAEDAKKMAEEQKKREAEEKAAAEKKAAEDKKAKEGEKPKSGATPIKAADGGAAKPAVPAKK
jgi:colicin import membrane protein